MVVNIECALNDLQFEEKMTNVYNTFNKYINYRFDYIIRTSINEVPPEIECDVDHSGFDPSQEILLACINSNENENNVDKLRLELKKVTAEVNTKRRELNIIALNEDGLRNNIKYLKDIIKIKESYIQQTTNYTTVRCNAKEKVHKEYCRVNKKYLKMKEQLSESSKAVKSNGKLTEYGARLKEKVERYQNKIKRMDEIMTIADDSEEKLEQYQIALQTSNERLKIFYDQLNSILKTKQEFSALLTEKHKRIQFLKNSLSNLGVLSSIEKSRVHTSSNLIEDDYLKKEFLELQKMRNDVLSLRPKGMFNPKYHKKNDLTKEDIRKYLENDEAINSIDYLIELKNYEAYNIDTDILKHMQSNTNEKSIFAKCLSTLSVDEVKKLLVHYFIKVVDLKETGRENDDLIAKLDEINDKQKHTIITLNNNYQEFHLSIEKKFTLLKKYYQEKLNMLFGHLQEENNAIVMFKMRQEMSYLRKKIVELEKSQTTKPKEPTVIPDIPHLSSEQLEASKSGSETMSSAKITYHKNKLKIQKTKSKLV